MAPVAAHGVHGGEEDVVRPGTKALAGAGAVIFAAIQVRITRQVERHKSDLVEALAQGGFTGEEGLNPGFTGRRGGIVADKEEIGPA